MSARPLCEPCADAWMRWLDYRPRQPIALITPGRTSVQDVLQAQKFRADDARDLIRSQQALIRSQCERLHNPDPDPEPGGTVFDMITQIQEAPGGVLDLGYSPQSEDFYRWQAVAPDGSECAFTAFYDLDKADAMLTDCQVRQMDGRPPGAQPYTRWALVHSHFTVQLSIVREE